MLAMKKEKVFDYIMVHKWPYWASAFLVGAIAVGYAKIVTFSENFAVHIFKTHPEYLFFISPLFFLASWALVHFIAPNAKGSGIPQVMAAIEMIEKNDDASKVDKLLSIKIILIKIISSAISLMGGGASGREGPTLQVSASLFYVAAKRINFVKKYISLEIWVITGAAAGLAAAFNTPLGGLVFAIEELATQHLNKFKSSLIVAVIIAGFSSQMISGPYLYLGYPKIAEVGMNFILPLILISISCGFLGALFAEIVFKMIVLKARYFQSTRSLMIISASCGLITACMIVFIDHQFMGSGKELMLEMLFKDHRPEFHVLVLRFFAPVLTYFSGGAGGIFAPSLAVGGSIGNFIASITTDTNINLCTMLGMIAFLTGVTRAPFTSFILVIEMTDRHSSIMPMMLSAVLANTFAKLVSEKTFYEKLKESFL